MNWRERALAIHYEDGAWPRWRLDKSFRYALRSLVHASKKLDAASMQHAAQVHEFYALLKSRVLTPSAKSIRIGAVGDWMWTPKPHTLASSLRELLDGVDLRVFNLETPIDPMNAVPRHAFVRFNAAPALLENWHSPTIVSLINNHALDQGLGGLVRSRAQVESAHLSCLGGLVREDASADLHIGDVTVSAVGCTYGVNPWGHGVRTLPPGIPCVHFGSEKHNAPWREIEALLAPLRKSDLVIVMAHWGSEYAYWPSAKMRADAYRLIEMGADLIIGSSPHVVQPVEVVSVNGWDTRAPTQLVRLKSPAKPQPGVIAFSLGNFVNSMPTIACAIGGVLDVVFTWSSSGTMNVASIDTHATLSSAGQTMLLKEGAAGLRRNAESHASRLASLYLPR
jgi:Bacterial capsule synthesis protein PGA_cap